MRWSVTSLVAVVRGLHNAVECHGRVTRRVGWPPGAGRQSGTCAGSVGMEGGGGGGRVHGMLESFVHA